MATIITHSIVPLSLRLIFRKENVPNVLLFWACVAAIAPDFDVIAFRFGISYDDPFGHRGATHSVAFALALGVMAAAFNKSLQCKKWVGFFVIFISTLSHPLLDALTDGGLGVALFWPLSNERFFFPWQPIEVSPIGLKNFLTPRGLEVIKSELMVVWLPTTITLLGYSSVRLLRAKFLKPNQ